MNQGNSSWDYKPLGNADLTKVKADNNQKKEKNNVEHRRKRLREKNDSCK